MKEHTVTVGTERLLTIHATHGDDDFTGLQRVICMAIFLTVELLHKEAVGTGLMLILLTMPMRDLRWWKQRFPLSTRGLKK